MAEELRRLRLEEALRLIDGTDDKLADIALACGFSDGAHLTHTVTKICGESPEMRRRRRVRGVV
jgi:transcriptional regulator GlxA family with amidase domain